MKAPPNSAVLITGSSTGIGLACVHAALEQGLQVYAGVRKQADADRLAALDKRVTPLLLDVTVAEEVEAARNQVSRELAAGSPPQQLLGIVNNAGIVKAGPLEYLPLEHFRSQLEVNVTAQIAVTQAFLPLLRQSLGRVVMIGSVSGRMTLPLMGPYSASKAALRCVTDAYRRELAPWGIPVSLIEPGVIKTPIWDKSAQNAEIEAEQLPAEAHQRYGGAMEQTKRFAAKSRDRGAPAELVAQAVLHALLAPRPKPTYLVGPGVGIYGRLIPLLPWRWADKLLLRRISS